MLRNAELGQHGGQNDSEEGGAVVAGNDASHDAWHVWRVKDLALSLVREEGLFSNSDSMEIFLDWTSLVAGGYCTSP
ncbi:hypothetical protein SLEP1_g31280 [Rubroshorea leprosula]|uniref:Uncharacterized protein n=1 Tax=Rubroshorea leprosula TaxID=152421 RepID=A0AAV5K9M3_9ROSI|nr:hypothetical protein SLEP1_g31280 [Rubroshorea leprosula]